MKYIIKKIASLLITLLIISFVTFFAFTIIPGDAASGILGMDATEEEIEALREQMGLNDNLFIRYGRWLSGAVQGDFGESFNYPMSVSKLISGRMLATVGLAAEALVIIAVIAVPLALLSAYKPNGAVDNTITVLAQLGMAIPQFFLGIILTYVFGILLSVFKVGGYVSPKADFAGFLSFLILPAVAIAIPKCAMLTKYLRDALCTQKKQDYVRTARSKGNSESRILFRHVLKNSMLSSVTFFAMIIADVFAGSIVVEQVFQIPGLGRLLISSISNRDYPVVSAIVLYIAVIVVLMNTLADILYRVIDPRVRN